MKSIKNRRNEISENRKNPTKENYFKIIKLYIIINNNEYKFMENFHKSDEKRQKIKKNCKDFHLFSLRKLSKVIIEEMI